jgi:hypothetical protein
LLSILNSLYQSNLGERPTNEVAGTHEAPLEYPTRASTDSYIPPAENLKGEEGRVQQVPQFMNEVPETLVPACGLAIDAGLVSATPELGDSPGDGVVKASVERAKVIRTDRRVQF